MSAKSDFEYIAGVISSCTTKRHGLQPINNLIHLFRLRNGDTSLTDKLNSLHIAKIPRLL